MQSRNPILSRKDIFTRSATGTPAGATYDVAPDDLQAMYDAPAFTGSRATMTFDDVVVKTATLLGVVFLVGAISWTVKPSFPIVIGAAIAGFVLAMVTTFKKQPSPGLAIAYAACQGVFLGTISYVFDQMWPGIAVQAVIGTALAFGAMLWAYRSGAVRVTPKFRKMVMAAGLAVLGLMVVNLVAMMFVSGGLGLRGNGPLAILFSVAAIGVAVFFLALDFDGIERAVAAGVPQRESWRAAFGLVVTLVWLYMEILRLIAILRGD